MPSALLLARDRTNACRRMPIDDAVSPITSQAGIFRHGLCLAACLHFQCSQISENFIMSIHPRMDEFGSAPAIEPAASNFWATIAAYLKVVFSGAKGDQGGWESGARGM